jgi:hypothetical protein
MPRNRSAMILVTQSELLELVEELRGMAAAAPTAKVRDALTRMADRYAARAADASRLRLPNHGARRSQGDLSHACTAEPSANG